MSPLHSVLAQSSLLLSLSSLFMPACTLPLNSTNITLTSPPYPINITLPLPLNSTNLTLSQNNVATNPIQKGYVAFGDSFAAGFGTGTTATGSCRKGEFSYPKQLASSAPADIDFQNLVCSGAKLPEVTGQIDAWTNPANADIATITIGGNDLGFAKILDACVVQSWGGLGQLIGYDCQGRIRDALAVLSTPVLRQVLLTALTNIITKSGREDFKIYLMGYPAFFNVDTTWCNQVTFWYAAPHHAPLPLPDGYPYLTQGLRQELNDLVQSLNQYLSDTVDELNAQPQYANNPQAVFVPTDPAFNGHRFCEAGVQEPAPQRSDTWFFLSGWGDNQLPGAPGPFVAGELITQGNTTALPDPATCDPYESDPEAAFQCRWSIAVETPGSEANTIFNQDMQFVAQGDFSQVRVPWWMPTRQAKTFHPRTLGQEAMKNAVMSFF